MAIAFELVADFGSDKESADACLRWLVERIEPVQIDEYSIAIHPPLANGYPYNDPTQFKITLLPANIGDAVVMDEGERISLSAPQISLVGNHLYDLLRGAPSYELAMVGWDVDFLLNFDKLNSEWASEITSGSFTGLVVKSSLLSRLPTSSHFVPFDDEHFWIPYTGSNSM